MSEELPPGTVVPPQASDEEVTSMVRAAIEGSRITARKVEDGGLQQPGVTVDLTHKNIARLPEEAIDVMKMEIERLAISHNRLVTFPIKLAECSRLRYLNVRYNALKEVPQAILKLETLEILDLSHNRIKILPEEIGRLKALKVLAINRNRIARLPLSLGDLPRLQLLKFDENPLVFPPPEAYAAARSHVNSSKFTNPNEHETLMTMEIKKYLRKKAKNAGEKAGEKLGFGKDKDKVQTPKESTPDRDGFFDSAETPRVSSRNRGGRNRFPVVPSNGGSVSDAAITSPSDAPPMPGIPEIFRPENNRNAGTRSHNPSFSRPLASRGSYDPAMRPADLLTPGSNMASMNGNGESTNKADHRKQSVLTPRATPSTASNLLSSMSSPPVVTPQTSYLVGTEGSIIHQFEPSYSEDPDAFLDRETQEKLAIVLAAVLAYFEKIPPALEWTLNAIDDCKELTEDRQSALRVATNSIIGVLKQVITPMKELNIGGSSAPPMPKTQMREYGQAIGRAFSSMPWITGYAQQYDMDLIKLRKTGDNGQTSDTHVLFEALTDHSVHLQYMRTLQRARDECMNLRHLIEACNFNSGAAAPPRDPAMNSSANVGGNAATPVGNPVTTVANPPRRRADTSRGVSIDTESPRPPPAQGPARPLVGSTFAGIDPGRSFTGGNFAGGTFAGSDAGRFAGSTLAGNDTVRSFSGTPIASSEDRRMFVGNAFGSSSSPAVGNYLSSPPSSLNSSLILETQDVTLARFPTSPVDSQASGDFSAAQGIARRGPPVEEAQFSRIITNTRKLVRLCMEEHGGNGSLASNLREFFVRKQQESISKPTNDPRAPERFQSLAKQCQDFARDLDQVSRYIAGMTDPARMNPDFLFFLKGTINAYSDVLAGARDYKNSLPSDIKTEMKEILGACKEVTTALSDSPWAWVMKEQTGLVTPGGAYPTTPLGAALGPAAAAAAPRSNAGNRSFNTRYDAYASNQQRRY
ncbi:cell morphogenesis protein-like protein Sog2 [Venturia nashicola]|nr:cell morphogenesis protein-like protein Sog2 [Venturia nashicola]